LPPLELKKRCASLRSTILRRSQALSVLAQSLSETTSRNHLRGRRRSFGPGDRLGTSTFTWPESAILALGIETTLLDALISAAPAPEAAEKSRRKLIWNPVTGNRKRSTCCSTWSCPSAYRSKSAVMLKDV